METLYDRAQRSVTTSEQYQRLYDACQTCFQVYGTHSVADDKTIVCPKDGDEIDRVRKAMGMRTIADLWKRLEAQGNACEAKRLIDETIEKLDVEDDRDAWFLVRLTKIAEALAANRATPGRVQLVQCSEGAGS